MQNIQKKLLVIYNHSKKLPNSGSVFKSLIEIRKLIYNKKNIKNSEILISIIIEIAYKNPRTYPVCAAIISKLLHFIPTKREKRKDI